MEAVVVHYGELALKGLNRAFFERALVRNIRAHLDKRDFSSIGRFYGRILVNLEKGADRKRVADALMHVFGIENFAFAHKTEQNIKRIGRDILSKIKNFEFGTFVVRVQRGNKSLPFTSVEAERRIGEILLKNGVSARVKLKNPELTAHVELFSNDAVFYFDKMRGLGGMPTGTAGKAVSLLSSGFDSPVASFKIMRRGAKCVFVHFHSYPHTSRASQDNVREIVKILESYQGRSKIYFVPFIGIQKEIMTKAPAALRVVLYRRYMIRIAEMVARRERADALVTGESLAQVASQTLKNIRVVSGAASLPVLRPLIGADKREIIDESRKLGLYEICARPYDDCCSLFIPKHPSVAAKLGEILSTEKNLEMGNLAEEAFRASF